MILIYGKKYSQNFCKDLFFIHVYSIQYTMCPKQMYLKDINRGISNSIEIVKTTISGIPLLNGKSYKIMIITLVSFNKNSN